MPVAAYAFAISFIMPALLVLASVYGSWWLIGVPLYSWFVSSIFDRLLGLNQDNPDPQLAERDLFWHRFVTWAWIPTQMAMIVGAIYAATLPGHLSDRADIYLMVGLGIATGGIGITYAHELIHSKNKWERWGGELLLCSVFYGHFTTEHLYNHHRYVATPKDPVTARYAEGFWRFFPRAVWGSAASAWEIDMERLRKRGRSALSLANPWFRHLAITGTFIAIAWWIGGWWGIALYLMQAFVAILQLEAVNYVEHYGLTRKHLGGGKYEHTKPRHSWNSSHSLTNLLLINLQRHSDHHYKPDRRFPLLQTYSEDDAPQLPYGYPLMVLMAMVPPVWFRVMNHRVKSWRKQFYPEIKDWSAYKAGLTPTPS
ncbi:MAG: alkane 1-monooxygenase [Pseudomonadota bacterium]